MAKASKNRKLREVQKRKDRRARQAYFGRTKKQLARLIKKFDNKVLYQPSSDLTKEEDIGFIYKMIEVLNSNGSGVGLAAVQIGVLKNVIIVDPKKTKKPTVMVNPEIIWQSEEKTIKEEGCLSYPGFYTPIERPKNIKVKYFTLDGQEKELLADEWTSRVISHEVDHLKPKCLVGDAYYKQKGINSHSFGFQTITEEEDSKFISSLTQAIFSCGKTWWDLTFKDMQNQLAAVPQDPNETIITHTKG